ncbi:MAG: response regulator [Nitrospirae bacterium]|nr:MAG: response regulator [Nitrospirota bacterium]
MKMTESANILVADDEWGMRRAIGNVLNELGFRHVATVMDGKTAAAAMLQENGKERMRVLTDLAGTDHADIDMLVLDMNMPGLNGLELLRTLRQYQKYQNTGIIMVTAASQRDLVLSVIESGADDYLVKPFPLAAFSERFMNTIKKKNANGDLRNCLEYADSLLRDGDMAETGKTLIETLSRFPGNAQVLHQLASMEIMCGNPDKAVSYLTECIERNPYFLKSYDAIADIYRNTGEYLKAVDYYQDAYTLSPYNIDRIVCLARLYRIGKHPKKIADILNPRQNWMNQDGATAKLLDGYHLLLTGRAEKSLDHFLDAIEINPYDTLVMQGTAEAYHCSGDYTMAEELFRKAIAVSPHEPYLHMKLGMTTEALGKRDEAKAMFETAAALNPLISATDRDISRF